MYPVRTITPSITVAITLPEFKKLVQVKSTAVNNIYGLGIVAGSSPCMAAHFPLDNAFAWDRVTLSEVNLDFCSTIALCRGCYSCQSISSTSWHSVPRFLPTFKVVSVTFNITCCRTHCAITFTKMCVIITATGIVSWQWKTKTGWITERKQWLPTAKILTVAKYGNYACLMLQFKYKLQRQSSKVPGPDWLERPILTFEICRFPPRKQTLFIHVIATALKLAATVAFHEW